ncbi:MAG: class I SAM-dependent methyltransferase family protein [Candidatus Methanomethylicus sp.]|nr:class I SAM-dependent methyltransferase family protein [Candidatus Methanomethylicus sp.]
MTNTLCLRVDKTSGELVKKILIKSNLLDHSRRITADDETVFLLIPVIEKPDNGQMRELCLVSHSVELISAELPPLKAPKHTLRELLFGQMPDALIIHLPRSFDIVGDILIIESLEVAVLPYKSLIGKSLLELNPNVKTVLLKVGKVEGEYRVPKYEFLVGISKYDTTHQEYGIKLKVDVSKVYFSPRLGAERKRIAQQVVTGETIVDMFAGVGPFSLLIAKQVAAEVISIDLNPNAINLLKENLLLNKLKGSITPMCGDARIVAKPFFGRADRVIMNLPGHALEFLDVALALIKSIGGKIHLYTFAKDDPIKNATHNLGEVASKLLPAYEIQAVRIVKPTAPREWQVAMDITILGNGS